MTSSRRLLKALCKVKAKDKHFSLIYFGRL